MPPVRAGVSPSPNSVGASYGRVRSASPARRALTLDMRRMANLLRDPPTLGGDGSINTSICSSPHSVMEPGDRGAAPVVAASGRLSGGISRGAVQGQLSALADKMNATISNLQWQCQEDRRRLVVLERKLESRLEERVSSGDAREKWADIQGSVNGLIEETQSLTRRVEGLDERLWARTSGAEASKQRSRELEQQVQALEHQTRLTSAAAEESSKRQTAKLRRTEHAMEEAVRRLTKLEEQSRHGGQQRDQFLESRVASLEQQLVQYAAEVRDVQLQLDEGLATNAAGVALGNMSCGDVSDELTTNLEESIRAAERSLSTLDRRLTTQVEEVASSLASMRVKVDGQLQRVSTLSERLETAHAPALESMRSELSNRILQDRRELESELGLMRDRLQDTVDGTEELRESVRQARAEVVALGLRQAPQGPSMEETQAIQMLDERCAMQEQGLHELQLRLQELAEQQPLGCEDGLEPEARGPEEGEGGMDHGTGAFGEELEEALRASERSLTQLEKRLTSQIEELTSSQASLRVKVDRQLQRVSALAERIETAHEPAVESLRADITQMRAQDRRDVEAQVAGLRREVQEQMSESREEAPSDGGLRELLRQVRHEIEALSKSDESPILRVIDERCGVQDDEIRDLRDRLQHVESAALAAVAETPCQALPTEPVAHALVDADFEEALAQSREELDALEKRLTAKVEDVTASVASIRVKVDGQKQRVDVLAERVEVAHVPALDSLRSELTQLRQQDQSELSTELTRLRSERATPLEDEASDCGRGGASAEAVRVLEERCDAQARALQELAVHVEAMPAAAGQDPGELDELREQVESVMAQLADIKAFADKPAGSADEALDDIRGTLEELAERVGQVEAASKAVAAEKAVADKPAGSADEALDDVRGTLEELAERVGQVEAASKAVAAEKVVASKSIDSADEALDGFRSTVAELAERVGQLETSSKEPAAGAPPAELPGEVAEQLGDLRADLDKLRREVEAKSAEKDVPTEVPVEVTEQLDDLRDDLDKLKKQVEGTLGKIDQEEVQDQIDELRRDLESLSAKTKDGAQDSVADAKSAQVANEDIEDLKAKLEKLKEVTTEGAADADKRLVGLETELRSVKAVAEAASEASKGQAADATEAMQKRLDELQSQIADVKDFPPSKGAGLQVNTDPELIKRLAALEDRVASGAGAGSAAPTDDKARADVQEQVEGLTRQLTDELAALARHQKDIMDAKESLDSLATKVSTPSAGGADASAAVRSLTDRLDAATQRLQALEDSSGGMRKDIEQLRGPRKVGISAGSENFSLEDARAKLELLSEQVLDMQARGAPGAGGVGIGARSRLQVPTPDASLNFSLTEQTDRQGGRGGDDSLGFSMTGSKQDLSCSDSVPILNAPPKRRSGPGGAAAPGSLSAARGGAAAGSAGDDDSDSDFDIEDAEVEEGGGGGFLGAAFSASKRGLGDEGGDILDSLAKGLAIGPKKDTPGVRSGEDALDSLVGLSGGSDRLRGKQPAATLDEQRGSGQLARVDEETSDLGDQSLESRASRSGSKQSPAGASGSKSKSSAVGGVPLPESPSSFSGLEGGLEVSMSCNEVSYGGDYSVEDSRELDQCDHVEEVKPLGPLRKQVTTAAPAATRVGGVSMTQPQAAAGQSGATSSARPASSPKDASQSKGDDQEYSDEDFDESESMAEEIEADGGNSEDESGD